MEKKTDDLAKLMERISNYIEIQKRNRKLEIEKAIEGNKELESFRKIRADWLESHKEASLKSIAAIWNWYKEFIASPSFRELADPLKAVGAKGLRISEIITCRVPREWGERNEHQSLSIKLDPQGLFVHNHVKYGKSYSLITTDDFLRYVEPPVLTQIAETIKNDSVWDIITVY